MNRLRRAMLFMPGDSRRKIEKGAGLTVDSIICDLEDAISMSQKEEARRVTAEALQELDFGGSERVIRINPVDSGLQSDDLTATVAAHPDAYMLPKAETGAQLKDLDEQLLDLEAKHNLQIGSIAIIPIIETGLGVVNLKDIAQASPRTAAICFGAEDYTSSIGAIRTPEGMEVLYARSAVVAHAKSFGLQAIDTPYIALRDLDGLREATKISQQLGFDGRMAIHPAQVDVLVEVFTPTEEEITRAQALIDTYNTHQAEGTGVFVYEGRMVDTPMLRAAQNVLARAGLSSEVSG